MPGTGMGWTLRPSLNLYPRHGCPGYPCVTHHICDLPHHHSTATTNDDNDCAHHQRTSTRGMGRHLRAWAIVPIPKMVFFLTNTCIGTNKVQYTTGIADEGNLSW